MNGIKIIRDYFGLTHAELAVFLNVSGSMLRMAETSKRLLPIHALVKLSMLDAQLQQPKALFNNKASAPHIKKHAAHIILSKYMPCTKSCSIKKAWILWKSSTGSPYKPLHW